MLIRLDLEVGHHDRAVGISAWNLGFRLKKQASKLAIWSPRVWLCLI
jgi:hypothetical protein